MYRQGGGEQLDGDLNRAELSFNFMLALPLLPGKSQLTVFGTINLSSRKDIKGANFHQLFQLADKGAVHQKAFQSLLDFIQINSSVKRKKLRDNYFKHCLLLMRSLKVLVT